MLVVLGSARVSRVRQSDGLVLWRAGDGVPPLRTFLKTVADSLAQQKERSLRPDTATSTRDVCATQIENAAASFISRSFLI